MVVEQLAGMPLLGRGLVAHEQVEEAVVVEVGPSRCLRWVQGKQPGRLGHVGESAVALVAQQGVGMQPVGPKPAAAQDEHIGKAVVVKIRLHGVEPAD